MLISRLLSVYIFNTLSKYYLFLWINPSHPTCASRALVCGVPPCTHSSRRVTTGKLDSYSDLSIFPDPYSNSSSFFWVPPETWKPRLMTQQAGYWEKEVEACNAVGWVSTDPHQRHQPTRLGPLIHTALGGRPAMVTHTHRSNISLSEKDATPITVSAAP